MTISLHECTCVYPSYIKVNNLNIYIYVTEETCLGKENWSLGMSFIVNMKQVEVLFLNYILTWE